MTLTTKISLNIEANYKTLRDLSESSDPLLKPYVVALLSGTGVGQADKIFHDTRTLTASSTEDIDLAGDANFKDAFGVAITFVKIKGLIVAAAAGNTNNVVVGGVAAGLSTIIKPQTTGTIDVAPGFVFSVLGGAVGAGYAVTATTADLLHIANGGAGTSVTYDLIIYGTSA